MKRPQQTSSYSSALEALGPGEGLVWKVKAGYISCCFLMEKLYLRMWLYPRQKPQELLCKIQRLKKGCVSRPLRLHVDEMMAPDGFKSPTLSRSRIYTRLEYWTDLCYSMYNREKEAEWGFFKLNYLQWHSPASHYFCKLELKVENTPILYIIYIRISLLYQFCHLVLQHFIILLHHRNVKNQLWSVIDLIGMNRNQSQGLQVEVTWHFCGSTLFEFWIVHVICHFN